MKTVLFCLTTLMFLTASPDDKTTLKADKGASSISYHCVHSLHEWTGINKSINCAIIYADATNTIVKVAVSGKVADFDSGNSNRDAHSMEVLDGIKFPYVTFISTSIAANGSDLKVTGNLTFHNVTRMVSFDAVRTDKNNQISIKGGFNILLTDFKVDRPSFMLMQIEDKMDLSFVMIFHK